MQHDHKSASGGGDYAWADMSKANTQSDASVSHSLTGTDTIDRSATESALNALGTIINDLIDKLQAANLMS